MVKDLHKPLLGRPAIEALELVARVGAIQEKHPQQLLPELFYGLGKLEWSPFPENTWRVAIPLMPACCQSRTGMNGEDGSIHKRRRAHGVVHVRGWLLYQMHKGR